MIKTIQVVFKCYFLVEKEVAEKKLFSQTSYDECVLTEPSGTRFKSFLDILLELRESDSCLTIQQIRSEVDTIILGGQETVATTLMFVMLMIGSKPDVQDKMYAE